MSETAADRRIQAVFEDDTRVLVGFAVGDLLALALVLMDYAALTAHDMDGAINVLRMANMVGQAVTIIRPELETDLTKLCSESRRIARRRLKASRA